MSESQGTQFTPSEEFKTLLKLGETLRYTGNYLIGNQVDGSQVVQHAEAIELVKGQFDKVDQDIGNHPEFPAWKKYTEDMRAAAVAARAGGPVPAGDPDVNGSIEFGG